MADEKSNVTDTTASGKKRKIIYGVLIALGIYGLVTAASRADWLAALLTGWGQ